LQVTMEADYAVRIVHYLSKTGERADARTISRGTAVTLRFALKILRKLAGCGIVESHVGAGGGYSLAMRPDQISLLSVIEAVEGPVRINRCLAGDGVCTRVGDKDECPMHRAFDGVNRLLTERLSEIKFDSFI